MPLRSAHRFPRRPPLFWRVSLINLFVAALAAGALAFAPAPAVVGGALLLNAALTWVAFGPFERSLALIQAERRASGQRAIRAQEEERRRVARELHDEIGQALTSLVIELDGIARLGGPLAAPVARARENARATLEYSRAIAQHLRPDALEDLGLAPALAALGERLAELVGTTIEHDVDGELPQLDAEKELVIYRVAQEGITNALRHAGCSRVELRVRDRGDGVVVLDVCDDGHGLAGSDPGIGMRGMAERALLVDADLEISSAPDAGTHLRLEVPIGAAA